MKPITWHTTKHGDRVFARHRENGALHSGTVSKVGHKYVRIQFDDNGSGQREYKEVFPMSEVFAAIKAGELVGMAEGKRL
jgi:hypothetical protein